MAVHVFIDGQEGTTGLRILERFANRTDIELMQIDPEKRKDPQERKKYINQSDITCRMQQQEKRCLWWKIQM